ncbi:MAG: RNA methyltransferase [Balneolaceae bacterium]
MKIKSASNNQIKNWKKLRMSKYRKKEKLFFAEGLRCVEQIIENGIVSVDELVIEEGFRDDILKRISVPVYSVPKNEFSELADTDSPQGILAVCREPEEADPNVMANKSGLIVAFDAIQDPGNLGTMIRTAAWFGAAGLIYGAGTVQPFHPKVVRSTAGATGAIPFMKGDHGPVLNRFEKQGWKVCLLDGSETSENIQSYRPGEKTVLVIGNEGSGISRELFTPERTALRIPGNSRHVESLNAAVALSIGLYHFTND